jgi:hypothetical protein
MICPKCGREAVFLKHSPMVGICRHCLAELLLTAVLFKRDQEDEPLEELYEDDDPDFEQDSTDLESDDLLGDEEEDRPERKPSGLPRP